MPKQSHDTSPLAGRMAPPERRGHVGSRTCVGCREVAGKQALIRLIRRHEGGAAIDATGRGAGRGAYLHAAAECLEKARKRRTLDRALRTTIQPELWSQMIDQNLIKQVPEVEL